MACLPTLNGKRYSNLEQLAADLGSPALSLNASNKFSRGALTLPEMELSFDKFRDLADLWKAYNPTKAEEDFYEYVRQNVDRRVNKGFMSAAFNNDETYTQKRKEAELDTRQRNLDSESKGARSYLRDTTLPQYVRDRIDAEQVRYERQPNNITEQTAIHLFGRFDHQFAVSFLESVQMPEVRTALAFHMLAVLKKKIAQATDPQDKQELAYTQYQIIESDIKFARSIGRAMEYRKRYSHMDADGFVFAVNKLMKQNRSGLLKRHKTAIDTMVAYARQVEQGQRKKILTDDLRAEILSGGKTREQIRGLKERAAASLRAMGRKGFSVTPERQAMLDYGYYEFLDGRQTRAGWTQHMINKGLADAKEVFDNHNFNPDPSGPIITLASLNTKIDNIASVIGTPALAAEIGQELANKINAEHRRRVLEVLNNKYKKQLEKKGIAGQMAAALINSVEKGQYDTDTLLNELARTAGAVELTPDDIAAIDAIYERAALLPEGRIREEELAKAWDYIYSRSRESLKFGDIYWAFYYANILSGPGTQALNAFDNMINLLLEPTVQITDQLTRGKLTLSTTSGLSRWAVAGAIAKGVFQGFFGSGIREMSSVFLTGQEQFRGKNKYFDSNPLELVSKGMSGKKWHALLRPSALFMRYVPRLMSGMDALANQAHFEMGNATAAAQVVRTEVETGIITESEAKARYYEILGEKDTWSNALSQARTELSEAYRLIEATGGKVPTGYKAWYNVRTRAREIVLEQRQEMASKNTYNDIGSQSSLMAAIGTYTSPPRGMLGVVANVFSNLVKDLPAARFVIPFINIVANVYNRQIDYTPWGMVRGSIGRSLFVSKDKEQYRWDSHEGAQRQTFIKGLIGTTFMFVANSLFGDDDDESYKNKDAFTIHGRGPVDYNKLKEMQAAGYKQYSIQYKGKFYTFNWTPFSLVLSMVANNIDSRRYGNFDDKTEAETTLIGLTLLGSTLMSASFVKSAADFLSFFQEGKESSDKLWSFLGRIAVSSAPAPVALMNTFHSAFDNKMYQADGIKEGIIRNIPIAKTGLKPALNAYGEVITKSGLTQDGEWYKIGELSGLNRFISTLKTDDDHFFWIRGHGLWPPVIGKTKTLFGKQVSDSTHYKLVEICGPNIKKLIDAQRSFIDQEIKEFGVEEGKKYIDNKIKDKILNSVEKAIVDQFRTDPTDEQLMEAADKTTDWKQVKKYVDDYTQGMISDLRK